MSLCANPSDPHLVGPVFVPPTGLSFRLMDAASSGKITLPGDVFPLVAIYGRRTVKVSPSVLTGLPNYNIQAVTY